MNSDQDQTALVHDPREGVWYQYHTPRMVLQTTSHDQVPTLLKALEAHVETRCWHGVGYISYEAAPAFDSALRVHPEPALPLFCFVLFESRVAVDPPFDRGEADPDAADKWHPSWNENTYTGIFESLLAGIRAGDFYQVNLTLRMRGQAEDAWQLFSRMQAGMPYAAFLQLPRVTLISASPELFVQRDGTRIRSRPMKGTAARGRWFEEDTAQKAWLAQSEKNRAENLMITDMVRNDMGRIADPGSVKVTELFALEKYPTVWQMSSEVIADTSADLVGILGAMFPAASITGAPKSASMGFIRDNEDQPREIYTGAIGVVSPAQQALFSVAIRTLCIDRQTGMAEYGVGGGIVADSNAGEEYEEILTKTAVLHRRSRSFSLLETMRKHQGEIVGLDRHMQRLERSAQYLDFDIDVPAIRRQIAAYAAQDEGLERVRLVVDSRGGVELESHPLELTDQIQPMRLARSPIDPTDVLLFHKTTFRDTYAYHARGQGNLETVLYNPQGFLTESVIANLAYRLDGQWFTPPIEDGLLGGTLRGHLVDTGELQERSLAVSHIARVDQWALINALRGWREAQWDVPS